MQAQIPRRDGHNPPSLAARYFAYGSNMDPAQMRLRVDDFTERVWGLLNGYALTFNKRAMGKSAEEGEGKGNVARVPKGITEGVLYEITSEALTRLDQWEKGYERKELVINLRDGSPIRAWVYMAKPGVTRDGLKPKKAYISHFLKGGDLLSPQYFKWLENTETLD